MRCNPSPPRCVLVLPMDFLELGSGCVMLKCKLQVGHPCCCNGQYLSNSLTNIPAAWKADQPALAIYTSPNFLASCWDKPWSLAAEVAVTWLQLCCQLRTDSSLDAADKQNFTVLITKQILPG